VKIETYSSFALAALVSNPEGVSSTTPEISSRLESSFGLKDLSPAILDDALHSLAQRGLALITSGRWELTAHGRRTITSEQERTKRTYDGIYTAYLAKIGETVGFILDDQQAAVVRAVLEDSLFEVFDSLSRSTAAYLSGSTSPEIQNQIGAVLRKHSDSLGDFVVEHAREIRDALAPAAIQLFSSPTPEFSQGLLQIAIQHAMWRILGLDPELRGLREDLLKGAAILLDTNILIAGLFEGSTSHDQTNWFLEATRSVGATLAVSGYTIAEFNDAVRFADSLYRRNAGVSIDLSLINNEITKTYIDKYRRSVAWDDFLEARRDALPEFLKTWGVSVIPIETHPLDSKDVDAVSDLIRRSKEDAYHEPPATVLRHDARNILLVQVLRKIAPESAFDSPWFVTRDSRLRDADSVIAAKQGFPRRSTMSPVTWFEVIYPYVWTRTDDQGASAAFVRILASAVAPIATPSFESFVNYVSSELETDPESEEAVRRIIRNSNLRNALRRDVELGNSAGAVATLQGVFLAARQTGANVSDKDRTITRLANRIQEYERRPPWARIRFNHSKWTAGLEAVARASSAAEKGKTLENFAEILIESLPGMSVVFRDVRTEAEEIDLFVSNLGLPNWGDPILVECKNWSTPVGKNEVVVFIDKLESHLAATGIIIAAHGVTGAEDRDARLKIRDGLRVKSRRVLVLTLEDLLAVTSAEELWHLLQARYYLPSRDVEVRN
jgi:hypothetical protein